MDKADMPCKVWQATDLLEKRGNTFEVVATEMDHGVHYWITFNSVEDHPLLKTSGHLAFWFTTRTGKMRFCGGELNAWGGPKKIKTWNDLRIIVSVYTAQAGGSK